MLVAHRARPGYVAPGAGAANEIWPVRACQGDGPGELFMTRIVVTRDLPCSAETFWRLFLDSGFMTQAFEALGIVVREVSTTREGSTAVVRKLHAQPPVEAPAAVRRLLGPSFAYLEDGRFDRETETWTWTTTPSTLADRTRIGGSLRVENLGLEQCRMAVEATIDVTLFGLGGLVEATGEQTIRSGWTKTADFFEQRLRQGTAAL
jgi:uncharacterized protein DUF2505